MEQKNFGSIHSFGVSCRPRNVVFFISCFQLEPINLLALIWIGFLDEFNYHGGKLDCLFPG